MDPPWRRYPLDVRDRRVRPSSKTPDDPGHRRSVRPAPRSVVDSINISPPPDAAGAPRSSPRCIFCAVRGGRLLRMIGARRNCAPRQLPRQSRVDRRSSCDSCNRFLGPTRRRTPTILGLLPLDTLGTRRSVQVNRHQLRFGKYPLPVAAA